MSLLVSSSRAALAADGVLAQNIPGFVARDSQQRLSEAIANALETRDTLLAEAGTGTGKTFAYLVPVLLSGMKTIISTGTEALQDQLYHRDLPRVRDALGIGMSTALLKGRANYLCKYRLEQSKGEPKFGNREQVSQFQRIVAWSGRTRMGDLAELEALPEDSPLLPMVTSGSSGDSSGSASSSAMSPMRVRPLQATMRWNCAICSRLANFGSPFAWFKRYRHR
jgi:ATP-dependent DNA helicase DinG